VKVVLQWAVVIIVFGGIFGPVLKAIFKEYADGFSKYKKRATQARIDAESDQ
jgi:hypothetical protein